MEKAQVSIQYCTQCHWLLRAAWLAQELLSTFEQELEEVALRPGDSGVFEIRVNDCLVWDRKTENGFPDAKVLKQRVGAIIAPDKDLGHNSR